MAKRKRWQKAQPQATAPSGATWGGQPNAKEREIERRIKAIEAKYKGKTARELPASVLAEYGRLHTELLIESQNRSGLTLINIRPNATGDGYIYEAAPFFKIVRDVLLLMKAGMPKARAIARAMDDERWRQQQRTE